MTHTALRLISRFALAVIVSLACCPKSLAQSPEQQMAVLVDSVKSSLVNGRLNLPLQYYLNASDLSATIALKKQWRRQAQVDTLEIREGLARHQERILMSFKALLDQNQAYCNCDFKKALTVRKYTVSMETGRNGIAQPMEIYVPLPECKCEGQEMALRIEDCFFLSGQLRIGDGIKLERNPLSTSTTGGGGNAPQPKVSAPLGMQGTVVLKPWDAYDTRDGAMVNMRSTAFGSEKLEIGYANNEIIAGPYKNNGQVASGASAVYDHGIWLSIEDLIAHHKKQGDMSWSSGTRSTRVVKGHCYAFAFQGRPPMYLRVIEVQGDGSIKLAWLDTDTRMSLKRAIKDSKPTGAISQQRLQGTWKGESSGQEMLAHFKADSVSFEGGLGSFLGAGPYKYTVVGDAIDISWNTPQANRTIRFQVFRAGDKLYMFEGKKEYTDIRLSRMP